MPVRAALGALEGLEPDRRDCLIRRRDRRRTQAQRRNDVDVVAEKEGPQGVLTGLDVDALRIVSEGVNRAKAGTDAGVLLITHYTRILRYISPDQVHVFVDGRIAEQGGAELADRLEAEGYDRFLTTGEPATTAVD